jgi:hypothetical protein
VELPGKVGLIRPKTEGVLDLLAAPAVELALGVLDAALEPDALAHGVVDRDLDGAGEVGKVADELSHAGAHRLQAVAYDGIDAGVEGRPGGENACRPAQSIAPGFGRKLKFSEICASEAQL